MRYDNLRAFEKHLEGAKPKHFSPLYFIIGKNAFECREAVDLLVQFLMPTPMEREIALSLVDGSQIEESELGTLLYTRSFFSKNRVIWIQQAEKLKKPLQEILENFFSLSNPDLTLILTASAWAKNTVFYKAAEKGGIILEFTEVKPWEKEKQLIEWVNKKVGPMRKLMAYPVCQFLVKSVGADQAILAQELEKLFCYSGDKKEITMQEVEMICTRQPVESMWSLGEAIFQRNAAAAIQMTHNLLLEGHASLPLLRQLRSQFQTGYQICLLLAQGKQASDITQEFPYLKGQILERHMRQSQIYGCVSYKQGLLALDAAEMRIKNSFADEKIIIELLILQLTREPKQ